MHTAANLRQTPPNPLAWAVVLTSAATQIRTRSVFEYDTVPLDGLSADERDSVLQALEALPNPGGHAALRPVVRRGQVALQATQFVGLYQLGPLRLQVLPKIHRRSVTEPEAQRQAAQNLFVMLRYAHSLPLTLGARSDLSAGADWLEIMTTIFTQSLLAEWQRGVTRRYEPVEEHLTTVRGRLRVNDHIRQVGRQHVLPVTYDEFMADIELNRMFRFVVEGLRGLSGDDHNQADLRTLSTWMDGDGVTRPQTVEARWVSHLRLDRRQARYELPFALAQLFLRSQGLLTHAGTHGARGLFFDMNSLFERFLTGVLREHRGEILPPELQGAAVVEQGEGQSRPLLLHDRTGRGTLHMKPDVLLLEGGRIPMILDFKYKVLDPSERRAGVSRNDLYQMFAYAQRYRCADVRLLYPAQPGLDTAALQYRVPDDGGHPARLAVRTVDVHQDLTPQGIEGVVRDLRLALQGAP